MQELRRHQTLESPPGVRVDAVLGNSVFELIADVRDVRQFRAKLMEMAQLIRAEADRRVILVLDEPRIGRHRLEAEWHQAETVLQPEIFRHLGLVLWARGAAIVFGKISGDERTAVGQLVRTHDGERPDRRWRGAPRRPEAFYEVLRVLLVLWFRRSGPVTSATLRTMAGCSYPTLATALKRLGPALRRHSDRRVELQSFPRNEWLELVSLARRIRSARLYTDRATRSRPPEILVKRLQALGRQDVGLGGVAGARHYFPGIDLAGQPRLSLTVHMLDRPSLDRPSRDRPGLDDLIRKLDPALEPAGPDVEPQLVVHTLYRPNSLFDRDPTGSRYADEVECLLDLHEARLEPQAREFLDRLMPKGAS